jgi:hypothetical protein
LSPEEVAEIEEEARAEIRRGDWTTLDQINAAACSLRIPG